MDTKPAAHGTRVFTINEVKDHATANDLWMIIYNKVYDITGFTDKHPGGLEVLIDCGGVDATEAFEDVAHSDDAVDMLEPYFIGDVHPSEHKPYQSSRVLYLEAERKVQKLKQEKSQLDKQRRKKKHFKQNMEMLTIVVLVMVVVGTVLFYFSLQYLKLHSELSKH